MLQNEKNSNITVKIFTMAEEHFEFQSSEMLQYFHKLSKKMKIKKKMKKSMKNEKNDNFSSFFYFNKNNVQNLQELDTMNDGIKPKSVRKYYRIRSKLKRNKIHNIRNKINRYTE